jgi:ferrous iron transport protein A
LNPTDVALVESLEATGNVRRRLLDLGFIRGSTVDVVRSSPLGDPTAYRVHGAVYAIRESEARLVKVRRLREDAS